MTVEPAHGCLRPSPRRRTGLRRRPSGLVTTGHAPGADPAGFKLRGFAGRVAGRRRPRGGPPTAPPGAVVRARAGQWQIGRRRWTRDSPVPPTQHPRWTRAAGTGAAWVARGRRATRAWFDPRHRSTGAGHHDMGLQRSTSPSAPPKADLYAGPRRGRGPTRGRPGQGAAARPVCPGSGCSTTVTAAACSSCLA